MHLSDRSYISMWRHKICKFAAEMFQNASKIGSRVVQNTLYSYYLHCKI